MRTEEGGKKEQSKERTNERTIQIKKNYKTGELPKRIKHFMTGSYAMAIMYSSLWNNTNRCNRCLLLILFSTKWIVSHFFFIFYFFNILTNLHTVLSVNGFNAIIQFSFANNTFINHSALLLTICMELFFL